MAFCYQIPYADRFGTHQARKWGETPAEAAANLASALANRGAGAADIGKPIAVDPQPFGGPMPGAPATPSASRPVPVLQPAGDLVLQ